MINNVYHSNNLLQYFGKNRGFKWLINFTLIQTWQFKKKKLELDWSSIILWTVTYILLSIYVSSLIQGVLVLKLLFNDVEFTIRWANGPISLMLHCCRAEYCIFRQHCLYTKLLGHYEFVLPCCCINSCPYQGSLRDSSKNTTKCEWYLGAFSPRCDKNQFPLDIVHTISHWR